MKAGASLGKGDAVATLGDRFQGTTKWAAKWILAIKK
jgi:hypothetical protein